MGGLQGYTETVGGEGSLIVLKPVRLPDLFCHLLVCAPSPLAPQKIYNPPPVKPPSSPSHPPSLEP